MAFLDKTGLTHLVELITAKLNTKANKDHPHTIADVTDLQSSLNAKVSKSGDTMTGKLIAPKIETGSDASSYFQSRKFRGEGDADTYYHAIDFGYSGNNKVDFYEYGGIWNFYKNIVGTKDGAVLVGSIQSDGWHGNVIGNASTATKLAAARTISITGSVTGSGTFDGSGNLSIATSTNHSHNYAGSSSAGGSANSAVKLDSSAGSVAKPVYFSGGKPVEINYTIEKSVPSNAVFTDTKNTSGSTDTSSRIFLVGATSQAANPQTYSDNEVYVTSGVLTTKKVQVGGQAATMEYDSTNQCINFVFN